jgi:hypothetical protein
MYQKVRGEERAMKSEEERVVSSEEEETSDMKERF